MNLLRFHSFFFCTFNLKTFQPRVGGHLLQRKIEPRGEQVGGPYRITANRSGAQLVAAEGRSSSGSDAGQRNECLAEQNPAHRMTRLLPIAWAHFRTVVSTGAQAPDQDWVSLNANRLVSKASHAVPAA